MLYELSVEFHSDSFYFLCKTVKLEPLSKVGMKWELGGLRKLLKKQSKHKWIYDKSQVQYLKWFWHWLFSLFTSFQQLNLNIIIFLNGNFGAFLMAQRLRIRLPMQGTWVRALVREDPTCCGATKPVRHNYWACSLEPTSHNYWAHVPQLLKPVCLEPVLHNKRSHCNEKPMRPNEE